MGRPGEGNVAVSMGGQKHVVHNDRSIDGTDLRLVAGGVAPRRGVGDEMQRNADEMHSTVDAAFSVTRQDAQSNAPSAKAETEAIKALTGGEALVGSHDFAQGALCDWL